MSVNRTILKAVPVPELPGYENRFVLLEYGPGAVAPVHNHPVTGVNYIIEGEVISQWEGGEPEHYKAGDIFLDYPLQKHIMVKNPSETKGFKVLVSYVIKTGEPNVKLL